MFWLAVAVNSALLLGLFLVAREWRGVPHIVLSAQSVYWFFAEVLRPVYVYVFRPVGGHALTDARLEARDFDAAITEILWLSVISHAVYLFVALALVLRQRQSGGWRGKELVPLLRSESSALFVVVSLGWIGRILYVQGMDDLHHYTSVFTIAAAALLIARHGSESAPWSRLVVLVLSLEVIWSLMFGSKAALLVPIVALLMRLSARGIRMRPIAALVAALGALAGFLAIQVSRGIVDSSSLAVSGERWVGSLADASLVAVLERLDGFSALADAYFLGAAGWTSLTDYLLRVPTYLIPFTGDPEATVGQIWTREVRDPTVGYQYQDVSLAAGPAAEGFVIAGHLGLVTFSGAFLLLSIGLCRMVESRWFVLVLLSAPVVFSTVLYEQSFLGVAERLAKGAQLAVLAGGLTLFFAALKRQTTRAASTYSRSL